MEPIIKHTGIGVPLRVSNVDTDQIIPAVYLKRVTKTGFDDALFVNWRKNPEFVLNQKPLQKWVSARWRAPILAQDHRVSTRSGRLRITGFESLYRHDSPIFFVVTRVNKDSLPLRWLRMMSS